MDGMNIPGLRIQGLSVALAAGAGHSHALHDSSLQLDAGHTLCVVGDSGSGKSVLATTVMGLLASELKVTQGQVALQGEALLSASPARMRALRGQAMGMVFQEPMTALNPVMRCGDQVDEVLRTHTDWPAAQRRDHIMLMLAQVRLPDPERVWHSYPNQLSGGQGQRIVIAMAMVMKPALLICDEPTTALDVTTQKDILQLIHQLQQDTGSAVLFITHDMGVVADIADQVLVMHQGLAVEMGSRDDVLLRPQADYTRALLAAVPSMTPPPARVLADTPPVLQAQAVCKTYGTHLALQDAALQLRAGETVGVVGESGSGKSTLARAILRLDDPDRGQVLYRGDDLMTMAPRDLFRLRRDLQMVFQDPTQSLNPRMTVFQLISEAWVIHPDILPRPQWRGRVAELLVKVGLSPEHAARYPNQFSGGQRQRIAIARALAMEPRLFVCDEAVSALDVSIQAQVIALLDGLRREFGLSYLFIAHDLPVVRDFADRVIVMRQGRIVEEGPVRQIFENPREPYTQALLAASLDPDPEVQAARRIARDALEKIPA